MLARHRGPARAEAEVKCLSQILDIGRVMRNRYHDEALMKILAMALVILASTASSSFADHERFIVGEMRNVDPSEKIISSTSGACVPSHDRERLECYFTTF